MKLQILSDLHLEAPKGYDIYQVTPAAPYLALLGDIGTVGPHKADLFAFLTAQAHQFRTVLFVPGNHEAYHSSWAETLTALRALEHETSAAGLSFVLLDRGVFRIPADDATGAKVTAVLGCSLFSAVPHASRDAVSLGLADFFRSRDGWDVAAHDAAHARDLAWLNEQVAALEGDESVGGIVVLTHWSPSVDARARDARHEGSSISSGFATDLSREVCFRSAKVKVWAFGHTHYNCDFAVEREGASPIRLVTNQRGYYFNQADGFDGIKTLNV
ncbi:hypothetical protein PspLS_05569 [Pyricularia sp. CBS 133598]|nr:hypothetical protein PspLS_05569 [Pyricularia sp. CBS 133598]